MPGCHPVRLRLARRAGRRRDRPSGRRRRADRLRLHHSAGAVGADRALRLPRPHLYRVRRDAGDVRRGRLIARRALPPCCSGGGIRIGSAFLPAIAHRVLLGPRAPTIFGAACLIHALTHPRRLVGRTRSGAGAAAIRLRRIVHGHGRGSARADFGRRLGPARAGGRVAFGRPWPCARAGADLLGVLRTGLCCRGAAWADDVWLLYPLPRVAAAAVSSRG